MSYINQYNRTKDIADFFYNEWIKLKVIREDSFPSEFIVTASVHDEEGDFVPVEDDMGSYVFLAIHDMKSEICKKAAELARKDAIQFARQAKEEAEEILRIVSDNEKPSPAPTDNGQ